MTYTLGFESGNYAILNSLGQPYLVIGPHDFDRQWGAWYTDVVNNLQDVPPWPIAGLRVHAQLDADRPSWLFTWNGLPAGTVGWNGLEWFWWMLDHWGNQVGGGHHIDVDPEALARFIAERQSVARLDESIRDVMQAELAGRLRLHRDETADMARMYGKIKARQRGKHYDAHRLDHTCTGYVDDDGTVSHDGNTCPIHEV